MEDKHCGARTMIFVSKPVLSGFAAVAGKKEAEGPLGNSFDYTASDTTFGEQTWEKAESRMQREAAFQSESSSSASANPGTSRRAS